MWQELVQQLLPQGIRQRRQACAQLAVVLASTANAAAVSVKPVSIVVGYAFKFAESAEPVVVLTMLILPPSLCSTYHPEYPMPRRCTVHVARPLPS